MRWSSSAEPRMKLSIALIVLMMDMANRPDLAFDPRHSATREHDRDVNKDRVYVLLGAGDRIALACPYQHFINAKGIGVVRVKDEIKSRQEREEPTGPQKGKSSKRSPAQRA
ncbi:unnamed protein product [Pleuronectes platessa]|uniref:Uncharacterized protein n=1 Tax=Pleuronectes platessa TaxID=8262 RepID=A0A9N7YQK1_PLEPL|nr:unnamed protein product [Pleuronectes platessa]